MEQDRRLAVAAEVDVDEAGWEGHLRRDLADNAFVRNVDKRFHT